MHYHSRRRHLSFIPLAVAGCAFIALAALVIARNQPEPGAPPPQEAHAPLTYVERSGMTIVADGPDAVLQRSRELLMNGATQIKLMAGGGVSSMYDPIDVAQYTGAGIDAAVSAAGNFGVVEQGALADLLLVDGDPLENLELVADPDGSFMVIMKDGVIHKNTLE